MGILSDLAKRICHVIKAGGENAPPARRLVPGEQTYTHLVLDATAFIRSLSLKVDNQWQHLQAKRLHVAVMAALWKRALSYHATIGADVRDKSQERVCVWWVWDSVESDHWIKKETRAARDNAPRASPPFITDKAFKWDCEQHTLVRLQQKGVPGVGDEPLDDEAEGAASAADSPSKRQCLAGADELGLPPHVKANKILEEILDCRPLRNAFVKSLCEVRANDIPRGWRCRFLQAQNSIDPIPFKGLALDQGKPRIFAVSPYLEADTAVHVVAEWICLHHNDKFLPLGAPGQEEELTKLVNRRLFSVPSVAAMAPLSSARTETARHRVAIVSIDSDQMALCALQHLHVYGKPWNENVQVCLLRDTNYSDSSFFATTKAVTDAVVSVMHPRLPTPASPSPEATQMREQREYAISVARFVFACIATGTDFTNKSHYTHRLGWEDVVQKVRQLPSKFFSVILATKWAGVNATTRDGHKNPLVSPSAQAWQNSAFLGSTKRVLEEADFCSYERYAKSVTASAVLSRPQWATACVAKAAALVFYWSTLVPPVELESTW